MHKDLRLNQTTLYKKVYKEGRSVVAKEVVLCFLYLNNQIQTKVGFSVSKKVGNAVVRNKTKRRLKSIVEDLADNLRQGYFLVLIGRPAAAHSSFKSLKTSVFRLAEKAGILQDKQ